MRYFCGATIVLICSPSSPARLLLLSVHYLCSCIGQSDCGYAYQMTDGSEIFNFKPGSYRGVFSVAAAHDGYSTISWTNTYMTSDAAATRAALEPFGELMAGTWAAIEAEFNPGHVLDTKWPRKVEQISSTSAWFLLAIKLHTDLKASLILIWNGHFVHCRLSLSLSLADAYKNDNNLFSHSRPIHVQHYLIHKQHLCRQY